MLIVYNKVDIINNICIFLVPYGCEAIDCLGTVPNPIDVDYLINRTNGYEREGSIDSTTNMMNDKV